LREQGINVAASHQRRGLCSEVFDRCRKLVHDRYSWAAFTAETAADNTIMRSILEKKGMKQTSSHIEDGVELVAYEDPQGRKL
jgi:RimJ/RimL family protein N-acetyltransferase